VRTSRVNWPRIAGRLDPHAERLTAAATRWRAVALLPFASACAVSDQKRLIDGDVERWLAVMGAAADEGAGLHSLLTAFPEFRSILYWRLEQGNPSGALLAKLMRRLWRPVASLFLSSGPIGPGLFIAHGYGTTLNAASIGVNCYVHQGVTLGWDYKGERGPIVGDNVFIGAGAVVLGAVTIGDGARIGANAVVLTDVPPGATAVGAPARVLVPEAVAGGPR
jgi:serine O-acetyltransferase